MHRHHWRAWRHQWEGCGPGFAFEAHGPTPHGSESVFSSRREEEAVFGSAGLGTKRPIRFLAYKLDMSREQINEASRILERLKIEREQASVDLRRAAADIADAFDSETFDAQRADAAADKRVETARTVQRALSQALRDLHELLDDEQRTRLATLIRSRAIRL